MIYSIKYKRKAQKTFSDFIPSRVDVISSVSLQVSLFKSYLVSVAPDVEACGQLFLHMEDDDGEDDESGDQRDGDDDDQDHGRALKGKK